MKIAKSNKTILAPAAWDDILWEAYYCQGMEQVLKACWPKLFGFHLRKIGALSADLNTGHCAIFHQVKVGLEGESLHIIADPYQVPFANKSADACLLAHTFFYTCDPNRLLQGVDRVLIEDRQLVISMFNRLSMLGLEKFTRFFFADTPTEPECIRRCGC